MARFDGRRPLLGTELDSLYLGGSSASAVEEERESFSFSSRLSSERRTPRIEDIRIRVSRLEFLAPCFRHRIADYHQMAES